MQWKPIPTRETLNDIFGDDVFCSTLFLLLLLNAADSEKPFTDKRGKTTILKRGQVVFGRNQYAKYMGLDGSQSGKVERALEKLQKVYKQIDKQPNHDWTLVEAINYDTLSPPIDKQIDKQQTSNRQAIDTSIHNTININNNTDIRSFIDWFNDRAGTKFQPLKQRVAKIKLRLSTFSLEELKQAAESRMNNEYMMGRGDNTSGKVYAHDIDSLIATDEKVDKWLNSHQKKIWDKKAIQELVLQFKHEGEPTPRYNELALHVRDNNLIAAFVNSRGQEWVDTYITPHLHE